MIDSNELRKGTNFKYNGEIFKVTDYKHIKMGRGSATVRVTVRNIRTGTIRELTFNAGVAVEDIRVEARTVQYLYGDEEFLTFMDMESYEQPQLRREVLGDDARYLKENMEIKLISYEGEIIDYEMPKTAEYEVIEVEMAVAGDRANNPTKKIKLEAGFEVNAPMFINVGDVVRINLEEGTYVTRVNS